MIEQERKLRTQMLRNAAQPMGRFSELFIFSLSLFIVSGTFLDEITFVSIAYTTRPVTGRRAVRNDEPILARYFAENDSESELVFSWDSWFLISCSKESSKCVNVFLWVVSISDGLSIGVLYIFLRAPEV